jgi:hypothetical protein
LILLDKRIGRAPHFISGYFDLNFAFSAISGFGGAHFLPLPAGDCLRAGGARPHAVEFSVKIDKIRRQSATPNWLSPASIVTQAADAHLPFWARAGSRIFMLAFMANGVAIADH